MVGVPTYGAVIGTTNVPLMDGTTFRIPRTGWRSLTGTSLENYGVPPDVFVDHQLERAYAETMKAPAEPLCAFVRLGRGLALLSASRAQPSMVDRAVGRLPRMLFHPTRVVPHQGGGCPVQCDSLLFVGRVRVGVSAQSPANQI